MEDKSSVTAIQLFLLLLASYQRTKYNSLYRARLRDTRTCNVSERTLINWHQPKRDFRFLEMKKKKTGLRAHTGAVGKNWCKRRHHLCSPLNFWSVFWLRVRIGVERRKTKKKQKRNETIHIPTSVSSIEFSLVAQAMESSKKPTDQWGIAPKLIEKWYRIV